MSFEKTSTAGISNIQTLTEQINQIADQLQTSEQRRQQLEIRMEAMTQPQGQDRGNAFDLEEIYEIECDEPDIEPDIKGIKLLVE